MSQPDELRREVFCRRCWRLAAVAEGTYCDTWGLDKTRDHQWAVPLSTHQAAVQHEREVYEARWNDEIGTYRAEIDRRAAADGLIITDQAARIERLEAQQAAALALHQMCPGGEVCSVDWINAHQFTHCADCNEGWPCATRRALTEDTP